MTLGAALRHHPARRRALTTQRRAPSLVTLGGFGGHGGCSHTGPREGGLRPAVCKRQLQVRRASGLGNQPSYSPHWGQDPPLTVSSLTHASSDGHSELQA